MGAKILKLYFEKMMHNNFVVLDELCHRLKLMHLFLRHVYMYICIY
jgi:hypothetical protein